MEDFSKLAADLQSDLGASPRRWGEFRPGGIGPKVYLLGKLPRLKLKMYQEKGHALPHLHVDYGKGHHSASYAIDPPRRLEGALASREEALVLKWIGANKDQLMAAWYSFQAGNPDLELIAELRGKA